MWCWWVYYLFYNSGCCDDLLLVMRPSLNFVNHLITIAPAISAAPADNENDQTNHENTSNGTCNCGCCSSGCCSWWTGIDRVLIVPILLIVKIVSIPIMVDFQVYRRIIPNGIVIAWRKIINIEGMICSS